MSKQTPNNIEQQWETVTIGKKVSTSQLSQQQLLKQIQAGNVKKQIVEKQHAAKNTQHISDIDARKLETNEIGHHQTPSHNLSTQIQQARNAKNLTQTQLNLLCNFPKGTVNTYESGKAIINQNELNIMSKHLGVTLKKNS